MNPANKGLLQRLKRRVRLYASASVEPAAPAQMPLGDLPPGFDRARYLQLHPDLQAAGVDPAQHYLQFGRAEGRATELPQAAVVRPDILTDLHLLAQLIQQALPQGFDSELYLELNPDVEATGADPVRHYLLHGRAEGRATAREISATEALNDPEPLNLDDLPAGFERELYLQLNPDVAAAGLDPVRHYLSHGMAEGRPFAMPAEPKVQPDPRSLLPDDFDPVLYRRLHIDLADPSIDPSAHYLQFGRDEQRAYSFPALEVSGGDAWQSERETVLLVSHEASRTGAPVLSLNLVQRLVRRYNVVAVLLGGGPLEEAFRQSGAAVVSAAGARANRLMAQNLVEQLCQRYQFKFALVNSIVSGIVLEPLGQAYVPTIGLVHEFASYTRPHDSFRNALLWSGEVVFSAKITQENAFTEYPDLLQRSSHILPQGRCRLPEVDLDDEELAQEQARLQRLLRPEHARQSVLVLGVGFVQLRKGVDLFIECAARVARLPGGENCRFAWIGKGFVPDDDVAYSVYLADQVRRAGLQQRLVFIDETRVIENAYREADMLLLSSRLDPLPNVAIDAMAAGIPVLCFEQTTGIADFLCDSGLREHCVADYLDTSQLARKVLAMVSDPLLRAQVAARCNESAAAYFSMDRYVASLEGLALAVVYRTAQERADQQEIAESGLFQPAFAYGGSPAVHALDGHLRRYVRSWASGIDRRLPYPGFHPGIYLEIHGVATEGADPFADYLRAGRPQGLWNYRVAKARRGPAPGAPSGWRVALHVHVQRSERLPAILGQLAQNRTQPDLFVSFSNPALRAQLAANLGLYAGQVVAVELVPERGGHIGPFLTSFGDRLMAGYDAIGHLHAEENAACQLSLESLLGSPGRSAMDEIMADLKADLSLGMIIPADPCVADFGASRQFAQSLAEKLGLESLPRHCLSSSGGSFWAKPQALAPLMALRLAWDDYPDASSSRCAGESNVLGHICTLSPALSRLAVQSTRFPPWPGLTE